MPILPQVFDVAAISKRIRPNKWKPGQKFGQKLIPDRAMPEAKWRLRRSGPIAEQS
jgi:hypothetical protein